MKDIIDQDENLLEEGRRSKAEISYWEAVKNGPRPEYAEACAKAGYYAWLYAKNILKGRRFPEGEKAILKIPSVALHYAEDVIRDRWPEAEMKIVQHPREAEEYAEKVIKGRWKEAEHVIAQDAWAAELYAEHVLEAPFPEGERAMEKDLNFLSTDGVKSAVGRYLWKVLNHDPQEIERKLKSKEWPLRGFALFNPVEMEDMPEIERYDESVMQKLQEFTCAEVPTQEWLAAFKKLEGMFPRNTRNEAPYYYIISTDKLWEMLFSCVFHGGADEHICLTLYKRKPSRKKGLFEFSFEQKVSGLPETLDAFIDQDDREFSAASMADLKRRGKVSLRKHPEMEYVYAKLLSLLNEVPEPEDMPEIERYDEAIIQEIDHKEIAREYWKGQFMQLMMKAPEVTTQHFSNGCIEWEWYDKEHSNYFFFFKVTNADKYPFFKIFINPWMNGGIKGWLETMEFKNEKQLSRLPKTLENWVKSNLKKTSNLDQPKKFAALEELAKNGVPRDIADAYSRVRQYLVPDIPKPEDMTDTNEYGW